MNKTWTVRLVISAALESLVVDEDTSICFPPRAPWMDFGIRIIELAHHVHEERRTHKNQKGRFGILCTMEQSPGDRDDVVIWREVERFELGEAYVRRVWSVWRVWKDM